MGVVALTFETYLKPLSPLGLINHVRIMTLASTVLKQINFSEISPFKCIRKRI